MVNYSLPLLYKGYKIRKENGSLCIFYPDGLKSAAAPGSTDAAKRMIDKHIDSTYSIYDESGFKDANVIEPVAVVSKPEAVYSNKNWAA